MPIHWMTLDGVKTARKWNVVQTRGISDMSQENEIRAREKEAGLRDLGVLPGLRNTQLAPYWAGIR
jgi:hypothetical protein